MVATSDPALPPEIDEENDPALAADLEFEPQTDAEPEVNAASLATAPPEHIEPDNDNAAGAHEPPDEESLALDEVLDEEPPFDPPELEEGFKFILTEEEEDDASAPLTLAAANEFRLGQPRPGAHAQGQLPVPPISIHISWDRPEVGDLLAKVAADRRLARAEIAIERGGFDGALVRLQRHTPDLLIVDTTLRPSNILASVERMAQAMRQGTKVIVLGGLNDVGLFRELSARGVSEYILPPIAPEALVDAVCRLYADADKSRVIAVIGARGGIGASTIAHNIAWSIAERQCVGAALVDLDLPFGAAALGYRLRAPRTLGDAIEAPEGVDQAALESVVVQRSERLHVLTAPANVQRDLELDGAVLEKIVIGARRMSSYVVLDLPHLWSPWVKHALLTADEAVIVASPDLASLRNADNMVKLLREERRSPPVVVLSMVGVPKRPEIPLKEFAEALDTMPAISLAFEPELFGDASMSGRMLAEVEPRAKAAQDIDQLATALTGRAPVVEVEFAVRAALPPLDLAEIVPPPPMEEAPQAPESAAPAEDQEAEFELSAHDAEQDPLVEAALPDGADVSNDNNISAGADASGEERAFVQADLDFEAANDRLEEAPIELAAFIEVEPTPAEDYIDRARRSAHAAAFRDEEEEEFEPSPPRESFGLRRMFAAGATLCVAVAAGAAWYAQSQMRSAAAVQPTVALAAVAPAAAPHPADPAAAYASAVQLLSVGDPAQAAVLMRDAAERGYGAARNHLGKLHEHGEGVQRDLAAARLWTERAARAGNVRAMHDLGVYHAMGDAGAVNNEEAARWFGQAAAFNLPDSQFNLGILYERGRGVAMDEGEALYWFLLAARQGDSAAAERAERLEAELDALMVEDAHARVRAFHPRTPDPVANADPAPQAAETTAAPQSSAAADIL